MLCAHFSRSPPIPRAILFSLSPLTMDLLLSMWRKEELNLSICWMNPEAMEEHIWIGRRRRWLCRLRSRSTDLVRCWATYFGAEYFSHVPRFLYRRRCSGFNAEKVAELSCSRPSYHVTPRRRVMPPPTSGSSSFLPFYSLSSP